MPVTRRLASPVLLVLVGIASVQFGSSLAKGLFAAAPPWIVAWLRLAAASVILLLVARPRLRGRVAKDWWLVGAYGLCMGGMNVIFYLSIQRIPIGVAVTIEFLGPLAVAVAGSRRARDLVWVGLAALGVALLGLQPGELDLWGVIFALIAAACWAGYILLSHPTGLRWEGVTGVTMAAWIGAIGLLPFVLGTANSGWVVRPDVWAMGAALGLLSTVIPYGLEMRALRTMNRATFGILMSLEPAAAALTALIVLGETLTPVQLVAMACVIAASVGAVRTAPTPASDGQ